MSEMPAAPSGMVWVLKLNPLHNDATLWLYQKSRWTGNSNGMSVKCRGLRAQDWPMRASLDPDTASIDEIVEATVKAAKHLVNEVAGEPERKAVMDAKTADLSRRLGIKVEVKR